MAVSEKIGNFPSAADPVGDAVVSVEDAIGSVSSTCENSVERNL
jgi:hypothetical protein